MEMWIDSAKNCLMFEIKNNKTKDVELLELQTWEVFSDNFNKTLQLLLNDYDEKDVADIISKFLDNALITQIESALLYRLKKELWDNVNNYVTSGVKK